MMPSNVEAFLFPNTQIVSDPLTAFSALSDALGPGLLPPELRLNRVKNQTGGILPSQERASVTKGPSSHRSEAGDQV